MNLPIFGADAALYTSSTHYRGAGSWTNGVGTEVELSQLALPAPLPLIGITCDGTCPGGCHVHCRPCAPDPTASTGCSRTCIAAGPDCDNPGSFTSPCPAQDCCMEPPVCGPCMGQTCQGTVPNCSGTPGTGTQSCTACGSAFTRPC
jgi:hypothetical protein